MILLALLVPALMMALLFAMDALEDLLFPPPDSGRPRENSSRPETNALPLTTPPQTGSSSRMGGVLARQE